jgi:DNA-binding SARP family transcriptional activator
MVIELKAKEPSDQINPNQDALCRKAGEFLIQGDYERLNELLRETLTINIAEKKLPLHLAEAARHLIQLCQQYQTEAQRHQEALLDAQGRERELLLKVYALLGDLKGDVPPTPLTDAAHPAPAAGPASEPSEWAHKNLPDWEYPTPTLVEKPTPMMIRPSQDKQPLPALMVYCLGPFRVYLDDQMVQGWPNCKGKSIFKYLVTQRRHPVAKEILMDLFWPEADPDAARNNLNVAIYALRRALSKVNPDSTYVIFEGGAYLLNPELRLWVDFEDFLDHVHRAKEHERRGEKDAAVHEFRAAEAIYQSEFLVEDRYEDWLAETRQNFQNTYLAVMEHLTSHYFREQDYETCVALCTKALGTDACNEEMHRRLMRCYCHMGQPHLALRQFHLCRESLTHELDISPSKETMELFGRIREREPI